MRDLIGKRFGKYVVLGNPQKKGYYRLWDCKCDCGNIRQVYETNLTQGLSKSCGKCDRNGFNSHTFIHGGTRTRLYNVWLNMRRRCYDKKNNRYKDYGGRGVIVCKEWMDFAVFREWAHKSGYADDAAYGKCTLDRIDVNGNYEPGNCRWTDIKQQARNRRSNHYLTYENKTMIIDDWAKKLNVNRKFIENRIRRGWTDEEAICVPYGERRSEWQQQRKLKSLLQK